MIGNMELDLVFLSLGALLLLGLAADQLGKRTRIPRVTLLILLGVAVGQPGLDLLPRDFEEWHAFLSTAALSLVAFALGGALSGPALRRHGREIVVVSLGVVVCSAGFVILGLLAIGTALPLALVFGGIATATAPAAMRDVVRQSGAKGAFPERLLGIVAIDDAWGLIAFGVLLVLAKATLGLSDGGLLAGIAYEIGGACALGLLTGLPAAYLTGRLRPGEPMLVEALGVVFLCAGLAVHFEVSFLLAGMICGATVAHFARHHERPFHEIENVQGPFLILFFLLAGSTMTPDLPASLVWFCAVYAVLRLAGRIVGGLIGGRLSGLSTGEAFWTGAALTPQAGVAIGMALVAAEHLPAHGETIVAATIATTIFFELTGPLVTQLALSRVRADR